MVESSTSKMPGPMARCGQRLDELMEMRNPMRCAETAWGGDLLCFYHRKVAAGLTCTHLGTVRKAGNHARKDLMALVAAG